MVLRTTSGTITTPKPLVATIATGMKIIPSSGIADRRISFRKDRLSCDLAGRSPRLGRIRDTATARDRALHQQMDDAADVIIERLVLPEVLPSLRCPCHVGG